VVEDHARCRFAALAQRLLVERRVPHGCGWAIRTEDGMGCTTLATVRKLTVLTIGFAAGLAFAPVANAQPGSSCDPNYTGACVPVASDVDCASGSGNGPAYVSGPVTVVGDDIYELDRDGNGTGCE
jgi:hypothetical protein